MNKVEIHAKKRACYCVWAKHKRADFKKTGIIENFKPFQDGKKEITVVKCILKRRITTLARPINRLSYQD